jgi:hypothetical protein
MNLTSIAKSAIAVAAAGALAGAVGCSKKGSGSDEHFGDWKADDIKAKLQGAWVGPSPHNLVDRAAYEITGDDVKVFANGKDEVFKLKIENPCKFGLVSTNGDHTTSNFSYVVRDGKLVWGGGASGARNGSNAVMCAGISVYAVEGDKCFEQLLSESLSGRWDDGKCRFRKDGGNEVFAWTWMNDEKTKPMDGDYLMPNKDEAAAKSTDFAAAKAALKP